MANLERRVASLEQQTKDSKQESKVVVFEHEPVPAGCALDRVIRVVFVKPKECNYVQS